MIQLTLYMGRNQLLHSVDNTEFVLLAVQLSIMRCMIIRMKTAVFWTWSAFSLIDENTQMQVSQLENPA